MNSTVWVLLGELALVSLVVLMIFVVARWHERKRLIAVLHVLLTNVHTSEVERQEGLQERLVKSSGLDPNEAESLSVEIIQSERKLFKVFAEILFGKEIRKVSSFDTIVYTVLDHYWELLAIESISENTEATQSQELDQVSVEDKAADSGEISVEEAVIAVESKVEEIADQSEPDPGSVAAATDKIDNDDGVEVSEAADDLDEPNWDDAFSEASQSSEATDSIEEILASAAATSDNADSAVHGGGSETPTEAEAKNS